MKRIVSEETRRKISEKLKGNQNGKGQDKRNQPGFMASVKNRWGAKNPNWKGDSAKVYSGHMRATRKYDISDRYCSCGNKAEVRHHIDENPLNNPDDESNIEYMCRACHINHHRAAIASGY